MFDEIWIIPSRPVGRLEYQEITQDIRIHVLMYDLWIVPVFISRSFIAVNFSIGRNKKIKLSKYLLRSTTTLFLEVL